MNFLRKLERRFGKYAIQGLTKYIIATYIAGYILYFMSVYAKTGVLSWLYLSPALFLRGQVWRLVSWILIPPGAPGIFTIIMLFVYYQLGSLLERTWGDFLYNVYIFTGLIMTVIGAFVLYFATGTDYGSMFSTYYVSLSIFLGFAMTFPEQRMLFMFFIPMKIKWLAVVDIAYLAYTVWQYSKVGMALPVIVMIVSSLAGTILFFLLTRRFDRFNPKEVKRKRDFRRAMDQAYSNNPYAGQGAANRQNGRPGAGTYNGQNMRGNVSRHRCAVCGRTELTNPDLEFRFCSKCNGNYEYCQEHLFTHQHVQ